MIVKEEVCMFELYLLPEKFKTLSQQELVTLLHTTLEWEINSFDVVKCIFSDDSWGYFLDAPTCYETDSDIESEVEKLITNL
jgi:hypothetical protein